MDKSMLRAMLERIEYVRDVLEKVISLDDAMLLAVEERTGKEPEPGAEYTAADVERANEIMAQCWRDRSETK